MSWSEEAVFSVGCAEEAAVASAFAGGGTSAQGAQHELRLALFEDALFALGDLFSAPPLSLDPEFCDSHTINHLSMDQKRVLWHQRLGHLNSRAVRNLYSAVEGLPKTHIASELEKCPVCLHAKLRKADRGRGNSRRATRCNQGISIDLVLLLSPPTTRIAISG